MSASPGVSRVIVVVLDGLRADAVPLLHLEHLERLAREGAATFSARTVTPSVTAAAMGSLLTGVRPSDHGLASDRFTVPRPRVALQPLPRHLAAHGFTTHAFLAALPFGYGALAGRLARTLGVTSASFRGTESTGILAAARPVLARGERGLFLLHWPDADRAGHAHGWTSRPYVAAARRMDEALGMLDHLTGASREPGTLLVAMADHGGGGVVARDHDSMHPHDRTIPLILAGGDVVSGELAPLSSLLDVPATIAWAMGAGVPVGYAGRAMVEAFRPASVAGAPADNAVGERRYRLVSAPSGAHDSIP